MNVQILEKGGVPGYAVVPYVDYTQHPSFCHCEGAKATAAILNFMEIRDCFVVPPRNDSQSIGVLSSYKISMPTDKL